MAEIKIGGKTRFENLLKQLFHSPLLDMSYALVGYFITSNPTRAHGKIVIWPIAVSVPLRVLVCQHDEATKPIINWTGMSSIVLSFHWGHKEPPGIARRAAIVWLEN